MRNTLVFENLAEYITEKNDPQQKALRGKSDQSFEPQKSVLIRNANRYMEQTAAEKLYAFLSDHSHAGFVSAFQVNQIVSPEQRREVAASFVAMSLNLVLSAALNLANRYNPARNAFEHSEFAEILRQGDEYREWRALGEIVSKQDSE